MAFNRRSFLKAAISIPLFNVALLASDAKDDSLGVMLSACSDENGRHYLALLRLQTLEYKLIPLAERGHALAVNPMITNQAVIAARRPGTSLSLIDLDPGQVIIKVSSHPNRHFYGHCSYSPDGKFLLTTENDYDKGQGVISIRDSQSLTLIEEIPSFGIGPHDLQFMPDQQTIVIANGGILTHPQTGRRKLNLHEMKPSLAYVDLAGEKLIERYHLADPKLSIRHIDVNHQGDVAVATQDQAEYASDANQMSLVGMHKNKNRSPTLFPLPQAITSALNRYTADICFESRYHTAAVSSPRGNLILILNTKTQTLLDAHTVDQPGAIALSRNKAYYVITTANGHIIFIDTKTAKIKSEMTQMIGGLKWDNHMSII